MNPNIEACRNCDHQCKLEEDANRVTISLHTNGISDDGKIREALSTMALKGSRSGCPSSEIGRIKDEASARIKPSLVVSPLFNSRIEATNKSSHELPQSKYPNRRLDRWRS